jgi:hypothetical protein
MPIGKLPLAARLATEPPGGSRMMLKVRIEIITQPTHDDYQHALPSVHGTAQ